MNRHVLGFLLIFCFIGTVSAWGPRGHKIVAQIASHYLDKSVADSVDKYLQDISLEKAGYWMDEVVMNASYDFMKPWHFVAIEADKTYVRSKTPDIVNVLENLITSLKKNKRQKKHFFPLRSWRILLQTFTSPCTVDSQKTKVEAPLNCASFFKSTDLHEVWDSEVLEYKAITTEDCLRLASNFTKRDLAVYQRIDVLAWMEESRALLSYAYDFKGNKLGDEYLEKVTPIIKMQLIKAGLRLAAVLNQTFKK